MSPQTIVITGSLGYFARVLLPMLEADSDIDRIVGIDCQPLPESYIFPKVEKLLDAFEARHPDIIVTRLRPCTVIGPQAEPSQEEDPAEALYLAVKQDLPGDYDVTSNDHRSLRQLVESHGGRAITLSYWIIKTLMALLWLTGMSAFAPEWVDLNRFSIIAGNNKLKATGRISKYSTIKTYEALQAVYS